MTKAPISLQDLRRNLYQSLHSRPNDPSTARIQPLARTLGPSGTTLLIGGGVVYTIGIVFYGWKRFPWNHAIWHLFVLGGSILHYFAVLFYVHPAA